ncbi:MAG: PD-(D/E)XK nuclease family protein [Planctomycetota bacterium]|nr:PD-(D/E)XK nuclease family protein [Planctomycetota bacterium]
MATKFQCELSWSASRSKEFERCRKENWYSRYGSWGWWTERPQGAKYEVMTHKNLTSLPALAGTCMHDAIEHWFSLRSNGTAMTSHELFEDARERFREGWRESAGDGWASQPNKSVHLEEHHYGEQIEEIRTSRVQEMMTRASHYFCESKDLQAVREVNPESWLSVESMDTWSFLGTKIYSIPDFAYEKDGTFHIWDWKTGRPREDDWFQLHTYALYGCEKWSADPESIVLHAAYLNEQIVQTKEVNIQALGDVQDAMSMSVRAMMEVHYDPDVDPCVKENWPENGAPSQCGRCRYRGLCPSGLLNA